VPLLFLLFFLRNNKPPTWSHGPRIGRFYHTPGRCVNGKNVWVQREAQEYPEAPAAATRISYAVSRRSSSVIPEKIA